MRDVHVSSDRSGVVAQVRSVPVTLWLASDDRMASGAGHEIGHLDEGVQLALLMNRPANEPSGASRDVRLTPIEGSVEAVGDEVLRCSKRGILAVDHDQRQSRARWTWASVRAA